MMECGAVGRLWPSDDDDDDDDDQPQSSLIGGLSSEVCTRSSIRQAPILITLATSN